MGFGTLIEKFMEELNIHPTIGTVVYEKTANKGAANGYAGLGADQKLSPVNYQFSGLDPTQVTIAASAVGTGTQLSRSAHKHGANALTAPANVTRAAAGIGVNDDFSRSDHKHDITTVAPGASAPGDIAAEGTASSLARSDHRHGRETAVVAKESHIALISLATEVTF